MSSRKKKKPVVTETPGAVITTDPKFEQNFKTEKTKVLAKAFKNVDPNDVLKWFHEEHAKRWKFTPMPRVSKMPIDNSIGSSLRMQNIQTMKYAFTYNTMDMIIVVMKLHDRELKKETNYGTVFCELTDSINPVRKTLLDKSIIGNVAMTYYSASPSHISCDGEYRSRFSEYRSLLSAKNMFPGIWMELEEYVTRIKERREWSIYTSYFYPKMEEQTYNIEIQAAIKQNLVSNAILVVSWFHTIFEETVGITKNHINQTYKTIMLKRTDDDVKFMKTLIDKYRADNIEKFRASISHSWAKYRGQSSYLQCGYKMIPLNFREVQDPMNMRYKPWREYFISAKCNDLVINQITPSFPIVLDWFYIKNSRKGLYDNKSQYERMRNSELAKEVVQILHEAQRNTYFASENLETMQKQSKQIKKWIGRKFKKLSAKIDDPINYSMEEIIMSEVTLAFASEHVGRTVADTMTLLSTSKRYARMLGQPFKESGFDYFAKYIFDICYGLLCANSLLGLIHGDFHLNNATIGALYFPKKETMENKEGVNKVVYVIDDETQFVFPNNGYFGCVIDFSRGIVNPEKLELFKDTSLPATQRIVKDESHFRTMEVHALLNLYLQMFPNKLKQKEELIVLFKHHFGAVFKLLTCIDLYMFSIRLIRMLRQLDTNIYRRCMSLLERINRMSENFIATEMNHLLEQSASYSKKIEESEWPIMKIIRVCFGEYNDAKIFKKPGVITDVYCYQNEMKYSVAKYDSFPPVLHASKYYDKKGKLQEVAPVRKMRKEARDAYEKQKQDNLAMVNYISMRHNQKMP